MLFEKFDYLRPQEPALAELDSAEALHVAEVRVSPGSVMPSLSVSIVVAHWFTTNIVYTISATRYRVLKGCEDAFDCEKQYRDAEPYHGSSKGS
jgi:hypothetical protein